MNVEKETNKEVKKMTESGIREVRLGRLGKIEVIKGQAEWKCGRKKKENKKSKKKKAMEKEEGGKNTKKCGRMYNWEARKEEKTSESGKVRKSEINEKGKTQQGKRQE